MHFSDLSLHRSEDSFGDPRLESLPSPAAIHEDSQLGIGQAETKGNLQDTLSNEMMNGIKNFFGVLGDYLEEAIKIAYGNLSQE